MKIDNRYIIYNTLNAYNRDVRRGVINDKSIVFIVEDGSIRTHKNAFGNGSAHERGFYASTYKLPSGKAGDYAIAKDGGKWYLYYFDEESGWTKGDEYKMPDLTQDILDNYISKQDIDGYVRNIYDDIYFRNENVYTISGDLTGEATE